MTYSMYLDGIKDFDTALKILEANMSDIDKELAETQEEKEKIRKEYENLQSTRNIFLKLKKDSNIFSTENLFIIGSFTALTLASIFSGAASLIAFSLLADIAVVYSSVRSAKKNKEKVDTYPSFFETGSTKKLDEITEKEKVIDARIEELQSQRKAQETDYLKMQQEKNQMQYRFITGCAKILVDNAYDSSMEETDEKPKQLVK